MAKTLRHAIIGRNQGHTRFACTICRAHLPRKQPQTIKPTPSQHPGEHIENVIFIFLAKSSGKPTTVTEGKFPSDAWLASYQVHKALKCLL